MGLRTDLAEQEQDAEQDGGQAASSLSDFGRGMRWASGRMDARRVGRRMVVPFASDATPQTPPRHPTQRARVAFFGWWCFGVLVLYNQT
ncbi:MAG: hypothetical protein ACOZB0_01150, partial [Pseudomonadota bacterium]